MRFAVYMAASIFVALAATAEPQAKAYVGRQRVAVQDPFTLFVEVSGSDVGSPQIPDVDGLIISKTPSSTSTSMQMSFVGNRTAMVSTKKLGYGAQATRAGKITVPPIVVSVDGQTIQTEPITITVGDYTRVPGPSRRPQRDTPASNPSTAESSGDQPTWDDAVFLDSTVSKTEAYQGEAVVLTLSIWVLDAPGLRVSTYSGQRFEYPTTEGFYASSLEPQQSRKERGGWSYKVTEYCQILYPTVSGNLTIGTWHWKGLGDYFPRQHEFDLSTEPIVVTVKPRPEAPADFSGAVGTFTLKAELPRNQLIQGVPAQFIVTVSGEGNPDALNTIALPKIPNTQISDPDKNVTPGASGVTSFVKTFTYAITPLEAGALEIPAISFCYFDPKTGAYKTEVTNPISVTVVLSSEENTARVVVAPEGLAEKGGVDVIGEDIHPIAVRASGLRPRHTSSATTAAVVGMPALAYCGLVLLMRRRRRFEQDTGYARDHLAKSKGRKRLRGVAQSAEPSEELYRAVAGYVADKFNIPEGGMTSGDIAGLFAERGIDGDLTEGITRILKACERTRYAGTELSPDEVTALSDAAAVAMDRLDSLVKRGRAR